MNTLKLQKTFLYSLTTVVFIVLLFLIGGNVSAAEVDMDQDKLEQAAIIEETENVNVDKNEYFKDVSEEKNNANFDGEKSITENGNRSVNKENQKPVHTDSYAGGYLDISRLYFKFQIAYVRYL